MNAKQKMHQEKLNQKNFSSHTYNYWKHVLKEELTSQVLTAIVPIFPREYVSLETLYRLNNSASVFPLSRDGKPPFRWWKPLP